LCLTASDNIIVRCRFVAHDSGVVWGIYPLNFVLSKNFIIFRKLLAKNAKFAVECHICWKFIGTAGIFSTPFTVS